MFACALGANGFLQHLHQQMLALVQQRGDGPVLAVGQILDVEEAGLAH